MKINTCKQLVYDGYGADSNDGWVGVVGPPGGHEGQEPDTGRHERQETQQQTPTCAAPS